MTFQDYETSLPDEFKQAFLEWAEDRCVSLVHEDDWLEWWACFVEGATTMKTYLDEQDGLTEEP